MSGIKKSKRNFSCYIVGSDSLLLQCAEILLQEKHVIFGIISSSPTVRNWAQEHQIPCEENFTSLTSKSFDFLFSIVNDKLIPNTLLKTPRYFAINYHDALLPAYAGTHATSWAILNGEKKHGVTWHVMNNVIDGGDILKQAVFDVDNNETTLSLNLKCYEHAVHSFKVLIDELAQHTYQRKPQDLVHRTYYATHQKPINNGWISWHQPAEAIHRLCRALTFGPYPNRLSTAKCILNNEGYIVAETFLLDKPSHLTPGTVIKIDRDYLQIATTSKDIGISKLQTLKGELKSVAEVCQRTNIAVGSQLISPTEDESRLFAEKSKQFSKNESFWVGQLENFKPASLPFSPRLALDLSQDPDFRGALILKPDVYEKINSNLGKKALASEILLTFLLIYLYRIGNQEQLGLHVGFELLATNPFIANLSPFSLKFNDEMNFLTCLQMVKEHANLLQSKGSFLGDICQRYPTLASYANQDFISVTISNNIEKLKLSYSSINILINETEKKLFLFSNKNVDENFLIILKNMLGHLKIMINAAIESPKQKISHLPLLTATERQRILIDWNRTESEFPRDKTVHQLFEEQVQKTPNNVAVIFENQKLTYTELNERSNQLAHYLRKQGVKPETLVAVCLERSLEMIIAILGILKAGGAYVPIDPEYPEARIQYMLEDSKALIILTQESLCQKLKTTSTRKSIICLDKENNLIDKEAIDDPENVTRPNNLIYVIYTSGSTGKPKGVLIEHVSVVNLAYAQIKKFNIKKNDRILNFASLAFDASVWEIFPTLLAGASLVVVRKTALFPEVLGETLEKRQVTITTLPPSMLGLMFRIKSKMLRCIISAGESLSKEIANQWKQKRLLVNAYGPTEGTVCSTFGVVSERDVVPTIGKPLANVNIYILDKCLEPLPVGSLGEIWIGGIGLTRGYLNQAELTQEKFVHNLFIDKADSRLYKTGDLARWLTNGQIEYVSRIDDQIKIRGYRIELGEINSTLLKHQNISQATVLMQTHEERRQLIAYFVKKNDLQELTQNELRNFLESNLPAYMVPNRFVEVKSIPLTSNGKVDRESLLKIYNETLQTKSPPILPKTNLEVRLLNLWCDIFKSEKISIKDNFFALGGDSILAMQLVAKAGQRGFKLSIKEIFAHPTIAELIVIINRENSEFGNLGDTAGNFSLTPIQHWFFQQNFLMPEQWGQVCLIETSELINPTVLEKSFFELIRHHDALRLRFKKSDDHGWQQEFDKSELFFKKVIKIPTAKSDELNFLLREWQYQLLQHFNFERGPLLGYVIFQTDISSKLLIGIHHLVVDGVSWRILLEDLRILYGQLLENKKSCLPKKTASFKDWYKALNHYVNSSFFAENKAYWVTQRKREYEFPTDFQLGPNIENSMKEYQDSFSIGETDKLFQLISQACQINNFLVTALVKAFEVYLDKSELYINFESHGRTELNDINVSRTAGWFTSLYPVYLQWNSSLSLIETLYTIRKQLVAVPNNGIDYGLLRYLDGKQAQELIDYAPVSFNYWGQFDQVFPKDDKFKFNWLRLTSGLSNRRSHLLDINCWVQGEQLKISIAYSSNLYEIRTVKLFASNFLGSLRELVTQLTAKNKNLNITTVAMLNAPKRRVKTENYYPLSAIQKGLLFHFLQSPNYETYCVQLNFNCDSKLDILSFKKTWNILIARHDVLRTSFKWDGLEEPIQIVHKTAKFNYRYYDWQNYPEDQFYERLEKFLSKDRQVAFDLNKVPLRIAVIHLPNQSYQIVISMHHILVDGWSLSILFRELNEIYQSLLVGINPTLPKPERFVDYILWLQQQSLRSAENFWQTYLEGFLEPTDLSINKSKDMRNFSEKPVYRTKNKGLSQEFFTKIQQFASENLLTLNTIFQGVWGIILSRYSQTDDVVFGTTISYRPAELLNSEQMIGIFINTLPLRVKLEENETVLNYLHKVQKNIIDVAQYQYTPIKTIQKCSNISSEFSLFKSIVVFENYPVEDDKNQLIRFSDIEIIDPTHYPLTFIVVPDKKLILKIHYDEDIISVDAIERLLNHIETLLTQMVFYPKSTLSSLNLLTTKEQQLILTDWNCTKMDFPQHKSVHQLFEEQVEKTPNRTAVVFENKQITYQELNERANQFAHYLLKSGIKLETLIAVYLERGLEMVVSILGILKAGGAYVPIDSEYPEGRIKHILADSKPHFLVTQQSLYDKLQLNINSPVLVILIDQKLKNFDENSIENPRKLIKSNNLMYVIYTSGSTGRPKGIMLTHLTIVNLIFWESKKFMPQLHDKIMQFASISFDVSVQEIFYTLLNGCQLHIAPTDIKRSVRDLLYFIEAKKINRIFLPTALLDLFVKEAILNKFTLSQLSSITVAGEELKITISIRDFFTHYHHITLINQYGPSESHVVSSFVFKPGLCFAPIGKPIANVNLYVLDRNFKPVPVGIKGELFISGKSLAKGYLDPSLDGNKFITNPFNKKERLYRTGDLVRWLPDGNLEYVGRVDNQIKIRGHRVELVEIESQLQNYPLVDKAIVILRKNIDEYKYLTAYLVTKNNVTLDLEEVQTFLKKYLPDYMIPTAFMLLKEFPLTNNGKVDKKSLPEPTRQQLLLPNYVAPRVAEEQELVDIWQEVLGVDKIGVTDNFFALGGHSLSALSILLKIRNKFSIDLPIRALFDAPSITQLSNYIRQIKDNKQILNADSAIGINKHTFFSLVPLQPHGDRTPLFLIHPIGGTVFWYVPLIKYLNPNQPCYGIQDPGIETKHIMFDNIEEQASFYITIIKNIQPSGPYLLGGASAGGVICTEIARQLLEKNEKIAFLGLFDSWVPHPKKLKDKKFFESNMRRQFYQMQNNFAGIGITRADILLKLQWQRSRLLKKYKVVFINQKLILFKAMETIPIYQSYEAPFNLWEVYSSQHIEVHHIPGDHETIFQEPNVRVLADKLNTCLNEIADSCLLNKKVDDKVKKKELSYFQESVIIKFISNMNLIQ